MLTDEQVEAYMRDGVLRVEGVVCGEELQRLVSATERVQEEAVAYGRELDSRQRIEVTDDHGFRDWQQMDDRAFLYARGPQGERVWRRAEKMWTRDEIFRVVTANPVLLNIVHRLAGREFVPTNDAMVAKMPGAGAAVPWHRDPTGDLLIETVGNASSDFICDVYVDEATAENGALLALPGSHRRPGLPDDILDFDQFGQVRLEALPGDVLIHSAGVVHGSPTNRSSKLRRVLYLRFRPPSLLEPEWGGRPSDWIERQTNFMHQIIAERAACSWITEVETFRGQVPA